MPPDQQACHTHLRPPTCKQIWPKKSFPHDAKNSAGKWLVLALSRKKCGMCLPNKAKDISYLFSSLFTSFISSLFSNLIYAFL